jgi:hypothetical protein
MAVSVTLGCLELIAALKKQHGFSSLCLFCAIVRTDTYILHKEKWEANARSQILSR